jgi:hypothetical protein
MRDSAQLMEQEQYSLKGEHHERFCTVKEPRAILFKGRAS